MQAQSSYKLIHIGLLIRLLRNLTLTNPASFAIQYIDQLTEDLDSIGFKVSLAGMNKIREFRKDLDEMEEGQRLGVFSRKINEEFATVERLVFAEASTKSVYTFPERRYNEDILLERPEKLLKGKAFSKLSDIAQSDIKAASRCILFGEATAAAFHMLRATEDTLRQYYFKHKKRNRLPNPMWGPMTIELRAKTRNKPPAIILDSLDLVRKSYRNPTQHPDAVYDIESAQDLMGLCLDLIGKMSLELDD